jgi:hypothetical protein
MEHISIAMILAVSFLLTGHMSPYDYREFVRTYSLSSEHLISARHFLQRDIIFSDDIEAELLKWYNIIFEIFASTRNTSENADFDARQQIINGSSGDKDLGYEYYRFMNEEVIPALMDFQNDVRLNVR